MSEPVDPAAPKSSLEAMAPPYSSRWALPCLGLGLVSLAGLWFESLAFLATACLALVAGVLGHVEIRRHCKPPRESKTSALALGIVLGLGIVVLYLGYFVPTRRERVWEAYVHGTKVLRYPWQSRFQNEDYSAGEAAQQELVSGDSAEFLFGKLKGANLNDDLGEGRSEHLRALIALEEIGKPAAPLMLSLLDEEGDVLQGAALVFFLKTYDRAAFKRIAALAPGASPRLRVLIEVVLYGLAKPKTDVLGEAAQRDAVLMLGSLSDPWVLDELRSKRWFELEEAPQWLDKETFPSQYE